MTYKVYRDLETDDFCQHVLINNVFFTLRDEDGLNETYDFCARGVSRKCVVMA